MTSDAPVQRRGSILPRPPVLAPARPLGRAARQGLRLAAGLLVVAAGCLMGLAPAGAEPLRALRPGTEMALADCLRVSALEFSDRNGALDPADWVALRLVNDCQEPVRRLQVDLLLLDVTGRVYGTTLWLLEEGEVLWPGQVKTDRYPVPDSADYVPSRWAVRLRDVERPSDQQAAARASSAAKAAAKAQARAQAAETAAALANARERRSSRRYNRSSRNPYPYVESKKPWYLKQ